jgi:hypothetical protein
MQSSYALVYMIEVRIDICIIRATRIRNEVPITHKKQDRAQKMT